MSAAEMEKVSIIDSADNISYCVLKTPGTVVFKNIEYYNACHQFAGDYKFYHIYIKCNDLRYTCLPLDANPREPTLGDVVTSMQETLVDTPSIFHHLNNGITVIADDVRYSESDKQLEIDFKVGEGICNGGHTYFSIINMEREIPADAYVHVEIVQLPSELVGLERKKKINDIAAKRNRNRALLPTTQADYLGYYNSFKDALGENKKFIVWHEGDSKAADNAIDSAHFVRLLASIDPFWFKHRQIKSSSQGPNHRRAASGITSIHNRWFNNLSDYECNLYHMAPLANDLLLLRDCLSFSLKNDSFSNVTGNLRKTNFYQWFSEKERTLLHGHYKDNVGSDLPATFEVLLVGAFRNNVWIGLSPESCQPDFIGYLDNFEELWRNAKDAYLDKLKSLYSSFDDDPAQFCRKDAAFEDQLIDIVYGIKQPEYPSCFYQLETGKRYVKERLKFTHMLSVSDNKLARLYSKDDVLDGENFETYKEI